MSVVAYDEGVLWSRFRLTAQLRVVFAILTLLMASVTIYSWSDRSSATDWTWFYRIGLTVAVVPFAWSTWRPRVVGIANMFMPFSVVAIVRVADFWQDWFLTPEPSEPVDLFTRFTLAPFGWVFGLALVVLVEILERLVTARASSGSVTSSRMRFPVDAPPQ